MLDFFNKLVMRCKGIFGKGFGVGEGFGGVFVCVLDFIFFLLLL